MDILDELERCGAETAPAIERFMGDTEMYLGYIAKFLDEPNMAALTKAVEEKNYDAAEKAVHALKGVVKGLGFVQLGFATEDMLAELRDGNIEDALDAFDDVKEQYNKFCSVIIPWHNKQA